MVDWCYDAATRRSGGVGRGIIGGRNSCGDRNVSTLALSETGLRKTDPRLKELRNNLMEVHTSMDDPRHSPPSSSVLDRATFKRDRHGRSQSPSVNGSPRRSLPIISPTSRWLDRQQFKKYALDCQQGSHFGTCNACFHTLAA
ncbi:hypothetical protein E2C01_025071 [Portunus trituberculatus]|uniref:Glutaminase EF-hand domain-containing protein n=1 Tax=Portunus trituberculatus TaxID=210409 RepID=A0A5B7EEF3_PORTR|nr:hypothetical protein [Portunus trituberculatus]